MSTIKVTAIPTVKRGDSSRPQYDQMVLEAIINLAKRGGSSRQAISSYILENYGNDVAVDSIPMNVRIVLKRGIETGLLIQNKQSYRISTSRRKGVIDSMIGGKLTKRKLAAKKKATKATKRPAPKILSGTPARRTTKKTLAKSVKFVTGVKKSRPIQKSVIELLSNHGTLSRDSILETLVASLSVPEAEHELFRRSLMANLTRKNGDLWTERTSGDEQLITIKASARIKPTSIKKSSSDASDSDDEPVQKRPAPKLKGDKPVTKASAAKKKKADKSLDRIRAAAIAASAADSDSE